MYLATSPRYDIVTWNGVVLECGTLYVVKASREACGASGKVFD